MSDSLDRIASLMTPLRAAVVAIAKAVRSPELPRRSYNVRWMEKVKEGRSEGHRATRVEPDIACLWSEIRQRRYASAELAALQQAAVRFIEASGRFQSYVGSAMIPQQAEVLVVRYFERVGAVNADDAILAAICWEYQDALAAETFVYQAVYRAIGFAAVEPFDLSPGISLRPLGDDDLDRFGRDEPDVPTPFMHEWLNREDWLCVVEADVTKSSNRDILLFGEIIKNVAVALSLTTPGRVELALLSKSEKSVFLKVGTGWGGPALVTARRGSAVYLDAEAIANFKSTFRRVDTVTRDEDLRFLRLPLRRLQMSSARAYDEDEIVDCVVALENMLARPILSMCIRLG